MTIKTVFVGKQIKTNAIVSNLHCQVMCCTSDEDNLGEKRYKMIILTLLSHYIVSVHAYFCAIKFFHEENVLLLLQ